MEVLSSRVLLRPRDLARSVAFYRDTLGLHLYREWEGGFVFFLGGGFLEVSGEPKAEGPGPLELWLQVPDLADTHEELRSKSVQIVEPPVRKPWGLLEMRARDPDGVLLVIVEVPEDHPLRRRR